MEIRCLREQENCAKTELPTTARIFTFQRIHFVCLLSLHYLAISSVLSCFYLFFYFTGVLFTWFNFIWWICLLLFFKGSALPFLSTISLSLPSYLALLDYFVYYSYQVSFHQALCYSLLASGSFSALLSFLHLFHHFIYYFLSHSCFLDSLFCLIVLNFFHGRPMLQVSLPVIAEAITNCHCLPTWEKEHQWC